MSWFTRVKTPLERIAGKRGVPEGVWRKCDGCKEIVYNNELAHHHNVCPKCDYHHRLSAADRIATLVDAGTFVEHDAHLSTTDPLKFRDQKKYKDRVAASQKKTGMKDAILTGSGVVGGVPAQVAAMEFAWQGGSMGAVVGEKLVRTFERGIAEKTGVVTVACSGGARMQEGIISLMQMAKTAAAVAELGEAGLPYISILADPTTGGVTASFAMLGDVIIAEPGALICFAGPRVIQQTIQTTLPDGFQRAEFLKDHGFVEMVVHRSELKRTVATLLGYMTPGLAAPDGE